jgi:endonuclease G
MRRILRVVSALIIWSIAVISTVDDGDAAEHVYKGVPKYSGQYGGTLKILPNIGYEAGYSEFYEDPLWSAYHIKWVPNATSPPRPKRFIADDRTDSRLTHDDYTQSDYFTNPRALDRGHMTPNFAIGSRFGADAQRETFFMSNICPQRATLNEQTWKYLEQVVANTYSHEFEEVWVVVGPIFNKKAHPNRLKGKASIPDAFYMIVLNETNDGHGHKEPSVLAVVMNQDVQGSQPLKKYVKTVDYVEQKTGLDFFYELDDNIENPLEASSPDESWELHQVLTE